MLVSKTANVVWNSKNKRHYVDLGYEFTGMGTPFSVKTEDLTVGSSAIVTVKCDYCGREYDVAWQTRNGIMRRTLATDCCKACQEIKAHEALVARYGPNTLRSEMINARRNATVLERYGVTNVFAAEDIKAKIVETNMERYGVPYTQQNRDVRKKTESTCIERYGVSNYVELFKGKFIKENSPSWKGGVAHSRVERAAYEYTQWRNAVFARDRYTCCKCGAKNGAGFGEVTLHAHHIENWLDNEELRYVVANGATLCDGCHYLFHSLYGKRHNTREQFDRYLKSDKKVC